MNNASLSRWRIALFCLSAAALALSLFVPSSRTGWLFVVSVLFGVAWLALASLEPRDEPRGGLLRPAPPTWSETIPTQPAALGAAARRTALGNAQEQLGVAIEHLILVTSDPHSPEALGAARAWLRRIGAI